MRSEQNRKKELIKALASKDKEKLRKVLSKNKPVKWLTIDIDDAKKTIQYEDKIVTESEMNSIIEEASKEYQVKLMIFSQTRTDGGLEEKWSFCEGETIGDFKA
jgi:hypothetical protein